MIHANNGRTLSPGQVEFNRSIAWGILSDIEANDFDPYVAKQDLAGNEIPASERQVMDRSAIESFIEGIASRYGVFFLTSSEIDVKPVPLAINEEK